jgi:hypothetical protein
MLRSLREAVGYKILAVDEPIGTISDMYFDDVSWALRYVVVDTGSWLPGRKVLISPESLGEPDWRHSTVPATLTKERIENAPSIASDQPVSRQHEIQLAAYYGWPPYWASVGAPPIGTVPVGVVPRKREMEGERVRGDPHLRSIEEVTGYHINAKDGRVGHVEDFVAETDGWQLRYLLVDTRDWLPGRKVLVAVGWIDHVTWAGREVCVDLTRDEIKNSPEFNPAAAINREYEVRLYDYYGRPKYWERPGYPMPI